MVTDHVVFLLVRKESNKLDELLELIESMDLDILDYVFEEEEYTFFPCIMEA